MAFTDLEEHLLEAFGEDSQRLAYDSSISWRRFTPGPRAATPSRRAAWKAKDQRQSTQRLGVQLVAALSGLTPARCQLEGCCNLLLPVRPHGGEPQYYCRRTHTLGFRKKQQLRDAAWHRAKRERRRVRRLSSGELPTRCQWEGCHNLLRFRGGKPPRYCCKVLHGGYKPRVPVEQRVCEAPGCGEPFTTKRGKRTCSNACRQRAWYQSRK